MTRIHREEAVMLVLAFGMQLKHGTGGWQLHSSNVMLHKVAALMLLYEIWLLNNETAHTLPGNHVGVGSK
jgi:hypothetical protein